MRVMKIRKDKTFPKMKLNQTVQKIKWYPKSKKFDKDFYSALSDQQVLNVININYSVTIMNAGLKRWNLIKG